MNKEYTVKMSTPVFVFLIAYLGYALWYSFFHITTETLSCVLLLIATALIYVYFLGCRPYKYIVDKRTVYIHRRFLPTKELDLMTCSTITDPIVKLTKWSSDPHAIEIYNDRNKCFSFHPKDRVNFTGAVMRENKRLHCTVKDYTDIHRKLEKRNRKERKKAERAAARESQES
jgi:hypothetical protein